MESFKKLGVPIMSEAQQVYCHVAASDKFIQMEKMCSKTRHDEAQALNNAQREEREKLQGVTADKDAEITRLCALLLGEN